MLKTELGVLEQLEDVLAVPGGAMIRRWITAPMVRAGASA